MTTFAGQGGDRVDINGDWAFVADTSDCQVETYRLDHGGPMDWQFQDTINVPPDFAIIGPLICLISDFSFDISSDGDLLVVSAPLLGPNLLNPNGEGGILLYERNNLTWDLQAVGNAYGNNVHKPADAQAGARFGESVAVSQITDTTYLIAVGAPDFDGSSTDNGQLYAYVYDSDVNTLKFLDSETQTINGGRLGLSVSADYPSILAGLPFIDFAGVSNSGLVTN